MVDERGIDALSRAAAPEAMENDDLGGARIAPLRGVAVSAEFRRNASFIVVLGAIAVTGLALVIAVIALLTRMR